MRRRGVAAFAGVMVGLLVVGAPAVAGGPTDPVGGERVLGTSGGLKYVSETLVVGSSGSFTPPYEAAWIACGGHSSPWHPVTGGARMTGTAAKNYLAALRPMDLDATFESPDNAKPDDWWDATVHSVLGRTLTGYVVCSKASLRYVSRTTPDATTASRSASASCPSGRHLVGGGAFIATTNSYLNSSYPAKNGSWKVRVHDVAGGIGGMENYAVCRRAKGVKLVTRTVTGIASGHAASATAPCPSTMHVIGGGGRLSGSISDAHLAATLPVDRRDADKVPDDGWKVTGSNDAGAAKRLTAYALCVRKG